MDSSLTDDQLMIRDAAEDFLADVSGSAAVRAAAESETGFDAGTWRRIASELGWCALPIEDDNGGLGLGAVEMTLILEQMGRRLLCAPFYSTAVLASTVISQVGTQAARHRWLPAIAGGNIRVTVPLPQISAGGESGGAMLTARPVDGGWSLTGSVTQVPDGATAEWVLLFAQIDDEGEPRTLFIVPQDARGLVATPLKTWDGTRRFAELRLDDVVVGEDHRLDDASCLGPGSVRALALAQLYTAAEQLGGAQQCLDLTVEYTASRKQFGRTIASFQAIKHRCAELMVEIEALRSAVYGTARLAESAADEAGFARECAMVKALASDVYFHSAQEAIQLHGGVGFTWEYDPQLHFKRAQASSHWLGSSDVLRQRIAEAVLSPSHDAVASPAPAGGSGDSSFRAEVAAWMQTHLVSPYTSLKHRGGPGDEEADPALRKEWERELAGGGWTCVGWPAAHGGRGLKLDQQVIFHEEYARAGGPGRIGHIGEGLIGPALIRFGSEAQKARFLPEIVAGREFWAQGYSEPGAGSDLANVQTRAEPQADGSWKVTGQKIWTSLAHESDWIFVLARCEPGSKGNKGLAFLLLPLRQPGIEIRGIRQMGGGCEFNEVFFDGAVAQADHIVGAPGDGWKVAMGLLEAERGVSTLGQQMHFSHELELVVQAALRNGRADDAQIRNRIARAWGGLRVMRYNALRTLSGETTQLRREALIAKYYWSNWHRDLGKLAADVLGAEADVISDDPAIRPLQQLFFFSRADTLYAGTNEIQLNLIAERGLSMPREPRGVS